MPRVLAGDDPCCAALWEKSQSSRAALLTYRGVATGRRIGELEIALRIVQQEEALCLELGNKDGLSRNYGNQAFDPGSLGPAGGGFGAAQERGSALPGSPPNAAAFFLPASCSVSKLRCCILPDNPMRRHSRTSAHSPNNVRVTVT
jgi:hypothetical protein